MLTGSQASQTRVPGATVINPPAPV